MESEPSSKRIDPEDGLGIERAGQQFDVRRRRSLDRGVRLVENTEKRSPVWIRAHQSLLGQPIEIGTVKLQIDLAPVVFFRCVSEAELNAFGSTVPEIRDGGSDLQNLSGGCASGNEVSGRSRRSKIDNFLRAQRTELVVLIDLEPVDVRREPISPAPPAMLRIAGSWRPHRSSIIGVRILWFQMGVARCLIKYGLLPGPGFLGSTSVVSAICGDV